MLSAGELFVRWGLDHPVYTQLLFWRPVPGFTPSPESYEPAVQLVARSRERLAELQQRGLVRADADLDEMLRDWTIVTAGVISQQLSNAPDESFATGTFASRLPSVVAMFVRHYAPTSSAPTRRARNARRG
jgi:hypothetical protein